MNRLMTIFGLLLAFLVPARAAEDAAGVTIHVFKFEPAKLEIRQGSTVTWTNQDDIRHTVTSGIPDNKDGKFDATLAGKGTSFRFTYKSPGTYTYFCDRHQHMRGEIQVRE